MHPQVRRLLLTGRKLAGMLAPIAALVTRLIYGHAFVLTGWGKWQNFDKTTGFFTDLRLPFPAANAALVASVELVGGACLILGLGTRLFSAMLSVTMVVALMTADRADFVKSLGTSGDPTSVVPLVYLAALLWLIGFGAGPISVDRAIARNLEKQPS